MFEFIEDVILPIVISLAISTALILGLTWAIECGADLMKPEPVTIIVKPAVEKECIGVFEVTAYCPCGQCCGAWADGIVYTGGYATEGQTIAVDPDVIPLGSVVEINGWQYVAEDIGGGINGKEIDLFFCSHEDALEWGRQNHEVYLVK